MRLKANRNVQVALEIPKNLSCVESAEPGNPVALTRCPSVRIPPECLVKKGSPSAAVLGMYLFDGTDKRGELNDVDVDELALILKLSIHIVEKPNRYATYLLDARRRKSYLSFRENRDESRGCESASADLPLNILRKPCVLILRDAQMYPDGHIIFVHPSKMAGHKERWYLVDTCTSTGRLACIKKSWMLLLLLLGCETILYPRTHQRALEIAKNGIVPETLTRSPARSSKNKSRFRSPLSKARKPWRS
jgi:hypothetical protein